MHRALKKKKAETGINVKDLGNCALRSVLERPLLAEAIGQKLVASGQLTEDEFEAVRDEALVAVFIPRKPHRPLKNPPVRNATGTNGF